MTVLMRSIKLGHLEGSCHDEHETDERSYSGIVILATTIGTA
jgi:hypothetical protein